MLGEAEEERKIHENVENVLATELAELRRENEALKRQLSEQNSPERRALVKRKENDLTPWNLCMRVQEKLGEEGFLKGLLEAQNPSVEDQQGPGPAPQSEKDALANIEWWTLVNRPKPVQHKDNFQYHKDDDLLGGPYVLLQEKDVVESVAIFVAQCIVQQSNGVPKPDELLDRINGNFKQIKEKGMLREVWDWGTFLHSVSKWGLAAYEIYTDPLCARILITSIVSSASWLGIGKELSAVAFVRALSHVLGTFFFSSSLFFFIFPISSGLETIR